MRPRWLTLLAAAALAAVLAGGIAVRARTGRICAEAETLLERAEAEEDRDGAEELCALLSRERAFLELFYEHRLVRRIEEEAAALRAAAREGQRTERLCRAASLRALLEGLAACDRLTPENVF